LLVSKNACYRRDPMMRIRQSLKSVSVLCLALLAYAALPHFHVGHVALSASASERALASAPTAAHDPVPVAPADSPVLRADESHETHSSSLSLESEPCTLCRNVAARSAETIPATPQRVSIPRRSACPPEPAARRPALLLAARHPSRAPPRA
jgi:hypothetical protein